MITVVKSNESMDNFRAVLESAYEDYYPHGLSNDLAAITLGKLEEQADFNINEMIELACSLPQVLNEDATSVTNPHIVQERKGKGISVTVNGKEYRYVSPDRSTEDLFRSFMGMYKHANAGYKALNYLKKNALCYYGAKNPKGKELVEAFNQGKRMIQWNPAANSSNLDEKINDGKLNESVFNSNGTYLTSDAADFQRVCSILSAEGIPYYLHEAVSVTAEPPVFKAHAKKDYGLAETTQPSDIPPSTSDITEEPEKPERPEFLVNEALDGRAVINTTKTGMSYYDEFLNPRDHDYKKLAKGLQGEIVMMSPDDYIQSLAKDIFHKSVDRVMRGVNYENVDKYADKMKNGTKFDMPILNIADETQEGRHRALAAAKLGVKKIPVLVITKWDARKELGLPKYIGTWGYETLVYTNKSGEEKLVSAGGINVDKMKAKIKELMKSDDIDTKADYSKYKGGR